MALRVDESIALTFASRTVQTQRAHDLSVERVGHERRLCTMDADIAEFNWQALQFASSNCPMGAQRVGIRVMH